MLARLLHDRINATTLVLSLGLLLLSVAAIPLIVTNVNACTPDFAVVSPTGNINVIRGSSVGTGIGVRSICGFVGGVSFGITAISPTPTQTCHKDVCTSTSITLVQPVYHVDLTPTKTGGGSSLRISVASTAQLITWTLTAAAYNGVTHHSQNFTVTAVDFTVTANPSSVSFQKGQTSTVTITTSSVNGYTGTINFSTGTTTFTESCPTNDLTSMTCDFEPRSVTLTSTTTSVQSTIIFGGSTPGTYTVLFNGSPTLGVQPTRSVTITITIR